MSTLGIHKAPVKIDDKNRFPVRWSLCNDRPVRSGHKAPAPEFDPVASRRRFVTDPVYPADITAVGQGMGTLGQLPSRLLVFPILRLFGRMPSDCCGIKDHLCSAQGGKTRRFWVCLLYTSRCV